MAQFKYTAKTSTGRTIEGTIDAPAQRNAADKLRNQRFTIVALNEIKQAGDNESLFKRLNPFKPGVKSKDLVIFSRQLATLVSAGVPIVQGLNILTDQIQSPVFKQIIQGIRTDIESGIAIADAMKKHPQAFSELYVSMIRAGETGGVLDAILERLSTYLESAEELRGKVKGAMVYPIVICGVATIVTLFFLIAVIPTFKNVFASFGGQLPYPTRVLLGDFRFSAASISFSSRHSCRDLFCHQGLVQNRKRARHDRPHADSAAGDWRSFKESGRLQIYANARDPD